MPKNNKYIIALTTKNLHNFPFFQLTDNQFFLISTPNNLNITQKDDFTKIVAN